MSEPKQSEPHSLTKTDLENVPDNTFNRVWEITKELNENIRHYNEHQTKYRSLASQWLIGAFAAMGFVLVSVPELTFNKLWLIAIISIVAAAGIFQLWRMDIPVFQRIISAFFLSGLEMEVDYPFLPQVKTKILKYVKHHNAGHSLFYFYFFIISIFVFIAASVVIYLTFLKERTIGIISSYAFISFCLFLMHNYMKRNSLGVEERKNKQRGMRDNHLSEV